MAFLDDSEEGLEPGHWYNLSARLKKLKNAPSAC